MGLVYQVFVRPVLSKLKYFMWTFIHTYGKGKVHPRTGHEGPEGEYTYNSALLLSSVLDRGGWSMPRPGSFTPPVKKNWYPLYRKLGGPQERSGQVQETSPPTGIQSPDCPACSKSLYWPCYHIYVHSMLWSFSLQTRPEIIIIDAELAFVIFSSTYFSYKENYLYSLEISLLPRCLWTLFSQKVDELQ